MKTATNAANHGWLLLLMLLQTLLLLQSQPHRKSNIDTKLESSNRTWKTGAKNVLELCTNVLDAVIETCKEDTATE